MNQYMSHVHTATPTAALHHTLQRHNEILQDYMQEFTRTKVYTSTCNRLVYILYHIEYNIDTETT